MLRDCYKPEKDTLPIDYLALQDYNLLSLLIVHSDSKPNGGHCLNSFITYNLINICTIPIYWSYSPSYLVSTLQLV